MRRSPPTPLDRFLQTPIPVLRELKSNDAASKLEAGLRERELMAARGNESSNWLCQMAGLHRNRGRLSAALSYADRAIAAARENGSNLDAAKGFAIRATIQVIKGDFTSARQTLAEVPPLVRGDSSAEMNAIYEESFATLLLRSVGNSAFEFGEGKERYQRAGELYGELGDGPGQIRCLVGLSSISSGDGNYFQAVEIVDQGLRLSAELDDWRYLNQLLGCAAFAFRDQGYRVYLTELFQLSIDWSTFVGDRAYRVRAMGGLADLYRMAFSPPDPETLNKAVALMRQAISEAETAGMGPIMLESQMALANLYQKAGDSESQRACRELAEEWAQSEAFEGANRIMNWNDLIERFVHVGREKRIASRLEEAIEGSSEPFFVFDPPPGSERNHADLLNEFRNSAANDLLGVPPEEVRLLADLASVPLFDGLREPLLRAVERRETYEDTAETIGQSGETRWFARRVAPAGKGAVVTLRDVTSTHKIEDALRIAADRANEADRAKSEFLANMSHEVRTPINGVLGLANLLLDLDLDPTARKYVEGIASSGTILLKVIGDVLDLSKIEARMMECDISPTPLHPLIQDVVGLFAGKASASGVVLTYEIGGDVPAVAQTDGAFLRQVLANLVGNALKFTRKGTVQVTLERSENRLRFEVSDTGIGISICRIDSIFEPFQGAVTDSEPAEGTGLGLTISRRLVELMGGEMGVTSNLGEGSRFYFYLPLTEAEQPKAPASPANDSAAVRFDGRRILLVEDNLVNVLVSEGILSRLGCIVTTAENGQIALDLFGCQSFDLVLMDIRMPVMDGLAATRAIRDLERASEGHIPIVALTAGALAEEKEACFEAGMDGYLVKPFTLEALRSEMSRVCVQERSI